MGAWACPPLGENVGVIIRRHAKAGGFQLEVEVEWAYFEWDGEVGNK